MDMIQSVIIVAAIVLLVPAFCFGIKAACRKLLAKTGGKESL